jgi:thiosulfate/3-mercaptopyruvate sulfurtransferase
MPKLPKSPTAQTQSPLVTPKWLFSHLGEPDLVIADVRWVSGNPQGAREGYLAGRIPGAVFVDIDNDLADRSDPTRGRHPLPDPQHFVEALAAVSIGRQTRVVAYDDNAGSIAARLWWMLRWLGHDRVWLLDGALAGWKAENLPLDGGPAPVPVRSADPLEATPRMDLIATPADVEDASANGIILLDARAPERFSGAVEPIDLRGGHIPGALNAPWARNVTDEPAPRFRNPGELRKLFDALGVTSAGNVICYCGSGVTACHNVLAMEYAGLGTARLYPGSWSEWLQHHE